jgi:hypothetical protein
MNNKLNQINNDALDAKYTSSKEGQNNTNTIPSQVISDPLDNKYTSSKEGQNYNNTVPTQVFNQNNNAQDINYCSATIEQNKQANNKINDSWDNPMVESKASIGSTIINQSNVQVQNIDSKVVQPQK